MAVRKPDSSVDRSVTNHKEGKKLKTFVNVGLMKLALCASLAAALAACGGGSGGNTAAPSSAGEGSTPASQAQLTGKAIDGYLAGATVCFDNGQGVCDTTLPITTTDEQGNYTLPSDPSYLGRTLLVTVTASTKDLSRPNYTFPASFAMSQIVTQTSVQNISPLSSLVSAQMQTGLSQAQATAAVSAMLGGVDPNADYIAAGDSNTTSTAMAIVNTLTSFATNGGLTPSQIRNTMNAIVVKGSPDVSAADVAAQANVPVYNGASAASVLANPTYALDGYLLAFPNGYHNQYTQNIVQDVRRLVNSQLTTTQQEFANGNWAAPTAGKYNNMYGVYEMKTDATWTGFVPVATYQAPLSVTTTAANLTGTDANTGIAFMYELRQIDLGNQALATAVPTNYYGLNTLWTMKRLTTTQFTAPTNAYLGLLSYNTDQVILPVWTAACDNPMIANGMVCDGAQPAVMEDSVISLITGDASTVYTSVQQAVGLSLQGRSGGFGMALTADGNVQFTSFGSNGPTTINIGTWSVYSRNKDVIVLNVTASQLAQLGTDPLLSPVNDGAKLVVALRSGHLRMGWLYPSTYADKTVQFPGALNQQLLTAVNAAVAASGQ